MSLLEVSEVVAGYGPVEILDRLSLNVAAGEIVAVLGSNGSGKSTALKTVAGLTTLFSGSVRFGGADISREPAHRRAALGIGYVPQTDNVFADLTVDENLRIGSYLRPRDAAAGRKKVVELFPRLDERRGQQAANLSGGERRMLAIAQTLLLEPKLIAFDEPSSDLAPNAVDAVFDTIRTIHQSLSIPILLVEQNVEKALALADRIYVLVRGREAYESRVADVDMDHLRRLFLEGTIADAE